MKTPEASAGSTARVAKASGFGLGGAFLLCCVLPKVVAVLAGAAVAAPLAKLDNPVFLAVGSVGMAMSAWFLMRRRVRA